VETIALAQAAEVNLANMRENGVRSLSVTCELCHHVAVMNVDTGARGLQWRRPL
jgi:hypothetical protein